jgi:preprotein translocase subunit SecA
VRPLRVYVKSLKTLLGKDDHEVTVNEYLERSETEGTYTSIH